MSKTPWSKALKEAMRRGEVIRESANDQVVTYSPRFRFDPDPWVSAIGLRYNGTECFAFLPERND